MMKVLFVMIAIIACVMASPRIPRDFCSLRALGSATLKMAGKTSILSAKLLRVKDYARYELMDGETLMASIISRPDVPGTAVYFATPEPTCQFTDTPLSLSGYTFDRVTGDGYNVFKFSTVATMTLDGSEVKEEFFRFGGNVEISITYTQNSHYSHETVDSAFSFDNAECPDVASNATDAKSSLQCTIRIPESFCSVSGSGTATISGDEKTYSVDMIRVQHTVRYDLKDSGDVAVSIIRRYDLAETFYNKPKSSTCLMEPGVPVLNSYVYEKTTDDDLDVFMNVMPVGAFYFDYDSHDIVMETFDIDNNGNVLTVTINYTTVNNDYVHEKEDDAFSFSNVDGDCGDAKTNAAMTKTSVQCSAPVLLTPVFPNCSFQVILNGGFVFSVMTKDGKFGYLKEEHDEDSFLLRCDHMNELGACLWISRQYDTCEDNRYRLLPDVLGISEFEYNGEPEDTDCPKGCNSTSCKVYCNNDRERKCVVVDDKGLFVRVDYDIYVYQDGAPTLDDFEGTMCDGSVIEAPVEDVCFEPSSSSSSSSSSSIPSSSSSSKIPHSSPALSPSSASFSLPSLCLVAVAVVLALF